MEETVPVAGEAVESVAAECTSAATASSSSLPSGEGDSGEQAPTNTKKTAAPKKHDAVPRVRRSVVKNIVRDEPKVVKINADFSCSLDARCGPSKGRIGRGASPPFRSCNSFCCFLEKNNRRDDTKTPRELNVSPAQAEAGEDGPVDRASAPLSGKHVPCSVEK